jgi:hypothetical protein
VTVQERPLTIAAAAVLAVTATLSLATGAWGGTLTQMSTDVPKSNVNGQTTVSTLYGADNTPPVIDLDIVGVSVTWAGGNTSDKHLLLESPGAANVLLANSGCDPIGFNLTFDDSAPTAFDAPGSCNATGTRRPEIGIISRLFEADPESGGGPSISGFWEMTLVDPAGGAAGTANLNSWGLRATFAPMSCSAGGEKQKLRKKIAVEVKCDSDAQATTRGDSKRRTLNVNSGRDELKVPLKAKARRRLDGGGKAKIKLELTNELGDFVAAKAKVRVTD